MTLDGAIKYCKEEAVKYMEYGIETECYQCGKEHEQLAEWLTELKEAKRLLKLAVEDMYNSVNDVHCKYCSKWHTDQCQGTSHLDCYIENKFKWRYADEALKLIGEDGGNDDTITGS